MTDANDNRFPLPATLADAPLSFRGVRFDVRTTAIRGADGSTHPRDIVVHPGSVLIVPVVDDDHIVLIRNERVAAGDTLWELPAGTLEPAGEDPLACARRELIEETGYAADDMRPLTRFFACPGISTEMMHAFVATGLKRVGQSLDATEAITAHVLGWDQAIAMMKSGEIRDGKTVAGLLYYHMLVHGASACRSPAAPR